MKTVGTILTTALVLLPWCFTPVRAQQVNPTNEKKIIINKRSVSADGTETTETIVKKGKAAENFDVEKYIKENSGENVDLDVRIDDGNPQDEKVIVKRRNNKKADWQFAMDMAKGLNITCDDNHAFLGVEQDSDEDEDQPGLTVDVIRGSAAEKAGLRNNDIILKLNGQDVSDWDELSDQIATAKPGDKMTITYSRNGQTATADATLTKHSEVKCDPEACKHGFLGITESNRAKADDKGVGIGVVKNSAAEKAGLQEGDILLQLNDTPIGDWEDVTDFMTYTKPDEKVRITYSRDGKQSTTEATLGAQKNESWNLNWEPQKLEIKIREKEACLGVYSSAFGEGDAKGARVSDFTTESAARDAEMNSGDVITAVNGVRVTGHDELWDEIAKYHTGDKVMVAFLRDNQPRQIEATLKACRDNSNRVLWLDTDKNGDNQNREFFLWNWNEKDKTSLREQRVITIHRGAEGDAPAPSPAPEQKPAPDRTLKLEGFRAYPNPSQGQVTVEFHSEPLPTIVSLLDMTGRQLFREELNAFSGDYYQQFDLTEYAKGTVVIHVLQGDKVFTEQIIVN